MRHYYYETKKHGYYFDRIKLNLNVPRHLLLEYLPIDDLLKESEDFHVRDSSFHARHFGFPAAIDMIAPSRKCLKIINKRLPLGIDLKISYVEITLDTFFETEMEAQLTQYKVLKTIRNKHSPNHFIYDQLYAEEKKYPKRAPNINRQLFSDVTGYFGSEEFKYVIYPRLSKIDNRPCLHTEWRIKGAANIKEKTGIISIQNLIFFDLKKFFDEQEKKYIVHEKIDLTKLGRWLLGCTRRKSLSNRERMKMGITGRLFCNTYKIKTYADLASHFVAMKKRLKIKVGPKTSSQKRILSLTNYGIWRF